MYNLTDKFDVNLLNKKWSDDQSYHVENKIPYKSFSAKIFSCQ